MKCLVLDHSTAAELLANHNARTLKAGDIVKFTPGLYPDETGATYRVLEVNGDRCIIEFVCDLPIPQQSTARTNELIAI